MTLEKLLEGLTFVSGSLHTSIEPKLGRAPVERPRAAARYHADFEARLLSQFETHTVPRIEA